MLYNEEENEKLCKKLIKCKKMYKKFKTTNYWKIKLKLTSL